MKIILIDWNHSTFLSSYFTGVEFDIILNTLDRQ